jgi:hypothetical protein
MMRCRLTKMAPTLAAPASVRSRNSAARRLHTPGLAHELGYQELSMIGLVYRPALSFTT